VHFVSIRGPRRRDILDPEIYAPHRLHDRVLHTRDRPRSRADAAGIRSRVSQTKPTGFPGFSLIPLPGGKLNADNISLERLIAVAYSVTDFQIFGNIPWLESDRYDMEARAAGPASLPQLRLMLRTLLADRFKLKFHREARELRIYSLTPAKTGLSGGPGLVEIPNGECSSESTSQPALPNGTPRGVVNMGPGRINGQRGRISQLADRLSTLLSVTVVDKTGLQGF
jgi:uncharacterized protein (TIGR03435 family)